MADQDTPDASPEDATTYPFDEAGLRESCDRAAGRAWLAEESRREGSKTGFHLYGIVSVAIMTDDAGNVVGCMGLDYADAPQPSDAVEALIRASHQFLGQRVRKLDEHEPVEH
jgi:hypothetical protein